MSKAGKIYGGSVLLVDERVLPLKSEVLLAKAKCDLQAKEEKAIRGVMQEKTKMYRRQVQNLDKENYAERKQAVQALIQSQADAEEILIRQFTQDPGKPLKYRGREAEEVSIQIDEEISLLRNILNLLTQQRKRKTQRLLDLQSQLASVAVAPPRDEMYPEGRQRCQELECQIEKMEQKINATDIVKDKYEKIIFTLKREHRQFKARLLKLERCIRQDIHDLEVCQDIMHTGHVLEHDAAMNLHEQHSSYMSEKKGRETEAKNIKKEVSRKTEQHSRKKVTLLQVDLDKVLKQHQDIFSQIQERRRTLVELGNWDQDFELLRNATHCRTAPAVTEKFEQQVERSTYLLNELERVERARDRCKQQLADKRLLLSSVLHTGNAAKQALEKRMQEEREKMMTLKSRQELADTRAKAVGDLLTAVKTSVKQLLSNLKFVPRPKGNSVPEDVPSDTIADLGLLRLKMITIQGQFEALGAPLRLDSAASLASDAELTPRNQFRVNHMARQPSALEESSKVNDMDPVRQKMKKNAEEFVAKVTTKDGRPQPPGK